MPGDGSVEKEICSARDSIFDEELHHEIHREARNLVNQGVRCVDNSVLIPFETDKQIEIDLVPTKDSASEDIYNSSSVVANIAASLRILLSYAHRQSLRNRSEKPPPLREFRFHAHCMQYSNLSSNTSNIALTFNQYIRFWNNCTKYWQWQT